MKKLQNITEVLSVKILFILILVGILSFLTMEFAFKMVPCKLCLIQRIPYYTASFICILFFFKLIKGKIAIILIFLCFLSAFFISGFHFLVEEQMVNFSCTEVSNANSVEELKEEIYNAKPSCLIPITIFGFRITILSLFYNLFILAICIKIRLMAN